MSSEERALRWPSLGELLKIEKLIRELDELKDINDGEVIRQPAGGQSRRKISVEDGISREHVLGNRTSRSGDAERTEDSKEESRGSNGSRPTTPDGI
jgi:hypothetical protein